LTELVLKLPCLELSRQESIVVGSFVVCLLYGGVRWVAVGTR